MKRPRALLCALLLSLAAVVPAHAAEPVPHAAFFNNPALSGAKLSPDGRYLALVVNPDATRDRLAVLTLADMSLKMVGQFSKLDINDVEWVNSERLVYNTREAETAPGEAVMAPGLFAVNRDGSAGRQLANLRTDMVTEATGRMASQVLPWHTYMLDQRGAQDSSFIYVLSPRFSGQGELREMNLLHLDTTTGRATQVQRPANTRQWLLDHKGEPRLVVTVEDNMEAIHYLDPANNTWRKVIEFDAYKGGRGSMVPLGFGPDGTLYVNAYNGANFSSLHTFNIATGKISKEPLLDLAGYDFSGRLVVGKDKLLGVQYVSDAAGTQWYDAGMKATQAAIDAKLPNTVNQLSIAHAAATPWVLVRSHSDVQPAVYRLYNGETKALVKVGDTFPKIEAARMATQDLVRYKARDGLEIPAWLTLPKGGQKNLPMVVLVHGGPNVRGNIWGWDSQAQFLASRGYAVLEPEFRGSTGFGAKHFRSGWKQWGLAMQNDVADGTRWAIAQGYADAKRVCIAGASYGGYAALMGQVNDPDLYQCSINWAGVTDIDLLYQWTPTSDMSSGWVQYGMPDLVGDRVKDAAQLRATSPIVQAARIKKPLLLAYGSADRRVPIEHGRKFYDAVKSGNPQVELVVYQDEGHGWTLPANRIDFWTRVEKFLDKHIGKP